MQGSKGLVKFFLVVMVLVVIYQIILTIPSSRTEGRAEAYADKVASSYPEAERDDARKQAYAAYLDSMSTEVVFSIPLIKDFTYQEVKGQQLALGLDLKGGMSVVLQVDLREFIYSLANSSKDPTLQLALDNASAKLATAQTDYVTLFYQEWQAVAEGKKLANIFVMNDALREDINSQSSDADVVELIREKANQTVQLTYERLKQRIDKFGVTQPNVQLDAARNLIIVELPGVDNPERARGLLQASAQLEFYDVYRVVEGNLNLIQRLDDVNTQLRAKAEAQRQGAATGLDSIAVELPAPDSSTVADTASAQSPADQDTASAVIDTVGQDTSERDTGGISPIAEGEIQQDPGPIFSKLSPYGRGDIAAFGVVEKNQRDALMAILNSPEVKRQFPNDLRWAFSDQPIRDEDKKATRLYELYALKVPASGKAPLEGDEVTNAAMGTDQQGRPEVTLRMTNKGASTWAKMTTAAYNDNQKPIAIVLDGEVVSAPSVNSPILNGNSSISGSYTVQEAQDLANILEIGKLPARPQIVQEALVGPSLGKDNINRSLISLAVGFLIVLVFMVVYYGGAGIVSIIALLANLLFIYGALASLNTVLTLPGIAGIVLTIGMAVDANVIIFERVREELRLGKSLAQAIKEGFLQSYSAIIDANVTTILTALMLFYFGLGPIKGFAAVLMIGVLSSVFAAVLVTRLIIDWWLERGKTLGFSMAWSENVLTTLNWDWIGMRKKAYMVSGIIILAGLVSMFTKGFDLGVDFTGGYSYTIQFDNSKTVSANEVRSTLAEVFGSEPVVKAVDTKNSFAVTTRYNIDDNSAEAEEKVLAKLHEGVQKIIGSSLSLEDFSQYDGEGTHLTSSSKIGPIIADDIKRSSIWATLASLTLIFGYIFMRFRRWQFSLGAIAALAHDVLITMGIFSIFWGILPFSMEIDQNFIAALLTVVGYSINDTVIIFDRIRETFATYTNRTKEEVINLAINNTISRTLITSMTTLFVVFVLSVFGGGSIKGFAFAILMGILVGTYSSIFIASPIVNDLGGADMAPKKDSAAPKRKSYSGAPKN